MGKVNNSGTKRNGRFAGKGREITVGIRVMGDLWGREGHNSGNWVMGDLWGREGK